MKTISPELQAHYESSATTLATLWKIERTDGVVFAFTDHDETITYLNLDYQPTSVFDASAVSTRSELNVDNLEVVGHLDNAGITSEDIEAGRWDGASVRIVEVNWADLTMGEHVLRVGELGNINRKRGQYTAELRGLMAKFANNIGRVITPTCDADLGDARCKVDIAALAVTTAITSHTSRRALVASSLTQDAGYFSYGEVQFTSGANDGIRMDITTHSAGGAITLQLPMPFPLADGDTFTILPGCAKDKDACKNKFSNLVNFRGFSFVPGQDKTMLVGGQSG